MTPGLPVFNGGVKVLLLGGDHPLKAVWQLNVVNDQECVQQHTQVRLSITECKVVTSKTEGIKMHEAWEQNDRDCARDFTFVDLMKRDFYLAIALESNYKEKFVATAIVASFKNMIIYGFPTGLSAQSCSNTSRFLKWYWSTRLALLWEKAWIGSKHGSRCKGLGTTHFDDGALYTANTEELLILFRAESNFR